MRRFIHNCMISIFVLSVITTHIYMNYLGIPFAAIELGLIPLVIIFSRKYCFFSEQDIIRVITIILILSTLSLIFLSTEQFLTIWKVIRSYLLFFFAFFFFF